MSIIHNQPHIDIPNNLSWDGGVFRNPMFSLKSDHPDHVIYCAICPLVHDWGSTDAYNWADEMRWIPDLDVIPRV